ncbi:AraC family transcriptional regulator [Candidatus Pristimantibacillus sp. PTI5]|uniref:AraC family transcriptional regulator n=1 Tax=Candidatus Pristimantibacillus sp. PTI5 TaxID=3400422 RepID=UPI003B018A3F
MKKWSSVFANLAVSYVAIVLVIVLLLCSVFYIYFSRNYKEELRNKNQLILENTAQAIETSVLQRVQQIYLDLSVDKTVDIRLFADLSFQTKLSKAIDLQELLKSEVTSKSDIVQAVHLYYPGQNIMLSSVYGLKFNADQGDGALFLADWIDGMRSNKQGSLWTQTRQIPKDIFSSIPGDSGNALITYARTYPFQRSGENSDLIIAIDVKENAISEVIQNMMPEQFENTFVWDSLGSTITDSNKSGSALRNHYDSGMSRERMSQSEDRGGSFNETLDQVSHVVSYHTLPSTGWKIYSVEASGIFYKKLYLVQKLMLGICLLAIFIGIVLSGILAKASYSPIKRLVGMVKGLPGHTSEQVINEYRLIDNAFIRLNDKVSTLEDTLQANNPIIKHNALMKMLHNSYTREELADELQLLGISQKYSHYCCMIMNSGEAFDRLSSGNRQYMAYRLINQLEAASLPETHIIAEELPDKKMIVVLCANQVSEALMEQLSHLMIVEGKQQFQLDFQIAWGSWVQEVSDVHKSCLEAQILMKYGYFMPETAILKDRSLLDRENSAEEIPQSMLLKFKEKLHARQPHEVIMAVEQLVTAMREGTCSADYCHFILANTVFVYSDYLKSVRYHHPVQGNLDLYHQYTELHNIRSYQDWLLKSINTFIAHMEKRNSERAVSSIESAKQYIHDHLSEDLSLETVASTVFISPKYLSKLFKEECGVTYTDYITSQRMERAKTLIERNNMTIEQIASTVGYGTAAYFIKKFKEMYGCTPGNYLRNTVKQA